MFKTVGDAFCAVFADPVAVLGAAVAAQRALVEEDWGSHGEGFHAMKVRMALHSGLAEERDWAQQPQVIMQNAVNVRQSPHHATSGVR